MRIESKWRICGVLAALALGFGGAAYGLASDATPGLPDAGASAALESTESSSELIALKRAASQGDLDALLRLGETYETAGSPDPERACASYIKAANHFKWVDRFHPDAQKLSRAYRRAANCYLNGVGLAEGVDGKAEAGNLLLHSGFILDDAESLFNLGKLFLSADGSGPNVTMAARFLENAARKQYAPAQALLGSLMWQGKIMKHRPAAGLALLILGMERTQPKDRAWISSLHDEAMIAASKDIEREAKELVEKWKLVHGGSGGEAAPRDVAIPTVAPLMQAGPPAPSKSPGRDLADGTGLVKKTEESHSPASAEALPVR